MSIKAYLVYLFVAFACCMAMGASKDAMFLAVCIGFISVLCHTFKDEEEDL